MGHSWDKIFRYIMAIASREKRDSQGHSGPTEAFFKTLWAALATCNIEMKPSVTNCNLGGCSTAKRGQSAVTVLSTELPVQGDEKPARSERS